MNFKFDQINSEKDVVSIQKYFEHPLYVMMLFIYERQLITIVFIINVNKKCSNVLFPINTPDKHANADNEYFYFKLHYK